MEGNSSMLDVMVADVVIMTVYAKHSEHFVLCHKCGFCPKLTSESIE